MLTISSDCLSSCFCPDEVAFCQSFDSSWCQECFQSNLKVCVCQSDILTSYWKTWCIFYYVFFFSLFHWNFNLHLLQDPHSGLEMDSCCILHQIFFCFYPPSMSLVKTWTCVTEREAFGLPAVPQNTFSHSHWSAPDALLIWCTWMLRFTWAELRYRHYSQSESYTSAGTQLGLRCCWLHTMT